VRVRLSAFRTIERLPGASHPAVYDVSFSCRCGGSHESLLTHDDLDWAPLAPVPTSFYNVMTGRLEQAADELAEHAVAQIKRGRWPWCFFCCSEERWRPVYPSAFRLVAPGRAAVAVAAECPSCGHTSANLVSTEHLDVPFYSDAEIGVLDAPLPDGLGLAQLADVIVAGARSASVRRLAG
jgi:hypothetical protein